MRQKHIKASNTSLRIIANVDAKSGYKVTKASQVEHMAPMARMVRQTRFRGVLVLVLAALLAPAFVGTSPQPTRPMGRQSVMARAAERVEREEGDVALGAVGIGASLVMAWSEWTLKTTGRLEWNKTE